MDSLREKIVTFSIENKEKYTWSEIAILFDLEPTQKTIKQLSDYMRYWQKTGNIVPPITTFSLNSPVTDTQEEDVTIKEVICDSDVPEGFRVKSMWMNGGGKLLSSYERINESEVSFEDTNKELFQQLINKGATVPKLKQEVNNNKFAYNINFPDLHVGKEPLDRLQSKFEYALSELLSRVDLTQVEKFVFPLGNDLFNSDTTNYTTTKGTPQFDYVEWKEGYKFASNLIIGAIEQLAKIAPVDIICIQGNHDTQKLFTFGLLVDAYFHNNENVFVDIENSTRKYYRHGTILAMFDHGEIKPQEYPLIFATEQPRLWGECKYKEVLLGHFHHEIVKEYRGVKVRYLPTITSSDAWHESKGYISQKAAHAYKWHREKGVIGYEQVNL
jgi:hypothetical protein